MSPLEELRAYLVIVSQKDSRGFNQSPCLTECYRAQLTALDALISERDALKARAEKAEAKCNDLLLERDRERAGILDIRLTFGARKSETTHDFIARLDRERDALRKALELARPYVENASTRMYDGTQGQAIRQTARDRLEVIDAALHGTEESGSKTCGECRHWRHPECPAVPDYKFHDSDATAPRHCFQPRDGAEEVKP